MSSDNNCNIVYYLSFIDFSVLNHIRYLYNCCSIWLISDS